MQKMQLIKLTLPLFLYHLLKNSLCSFIIGQ